MVLETIIFAAGAVGLLALWRYSRKPVAPEPSSFGSSSAASREKAEPAELTRAVPTVKMPAPKAAVKEPANLAGETVGGYRLLEFLGQGGMASVYKVRAKEDDRFLALKLILPQFAHDQAFRRRFEREVRVCKDLQHPNIVRLEDWGDDDGTLFLALEYVDGDVLTASVQEGGLPLDRVVSFVSGLVDGLSYAHDLGVVHRDLKPDNVMLGAHGEVKIADFGLARSQEAEKITKTGDSMGTPAYFPPEQVAGAPPTGAADQYSLGIMLYELLTGKRPFNEKNPLNMLFQHLSEPPPSPLIHKPDLHPTVVAIVLRMLEKSPESRFSSLRSVKEGLLAVAQGQEWELPPAVAARPRPERTDLSVRPVSSASSEGDDQTMEFQVQPTDS